MSSPYVGEILAVGFNFAPSGWLSCNGQLLSIADYDVLFTLLGTTYGGDGVNTFAVPNLIGRVPVHFGQLSGGSNYIQGQTGGVTSVTLSIAQMPAHTHFISCNATAGTTPSPAGAYFGPTNPAVYGTPSGNYVNMGSTVSTVGGSTPHDNMQPYLVVNYIIAYQGIFPTTS